jgi:GNAT superfamily N-acetyltransferase
MAIAQRANRPVRRGPLLPLVGKLCQSELHTNAARLYPMLAPPNSALSAPWYELEQLVGEDGEIVILDSHAFCRYVWGLSCLRQPDHTISHFLPAMGMAALDVHKFGRKRPPIVERVFVMPEFRRQGIATALVEHALHDFPKLSLDGQLSEEGAAFFGYRLR